MRWSNVMWGGALLLLGILFLLDNLQIIDVNVWGLFWPLLLIGLGASLLFQYTVGSSGREVVALSIPREDASKARVRVKHGAGRLHIGSGAGPGELLAGEFGGGVDHWTEPDGSTLNVTLRQPPQNFFSGWGAQGFDWEIRLNPDVVLALDMETGANDSRLDLANLLVSELRLQTGASSTHVVLPQSAGFTRVDVRSGVSSLVMHVPQGVAASIRASGGLATIDVDRDRFPRQGNRYESPDYETAEHKVEIRAETGVGSVRIS